MQIIQQASVAPGFQPSGLRHMPSTSFWARQHSPLCAMDWELSKKKHSQEMYRRLHMPDKHAYSLKNISKTLILPLWGRAVEQDKKQPLICDPTAKRILEKIDFDFNSLNDEWHRSSQVAWTVRAWNIDNVISAFLSRYHNDQTIIINLGCGLDTSFERNDDGKSRWYEVDLPDVIELRRQFIQENSRRTFVAGSAFSSDILWQIDPKGNFLIVAAGMLYYFEESDIRGLFANIKGSFPHAEMVFDICSPIGMKAANRRITSEKSIEKNAIFRWSLKSPSRLKAMDPDIRIIEAYPLFKKAMNKIERSLRMTARMSDFLKIMSMVHARFEIGKSN
jgi:O-methyltransferase involved in polyketide biosynthesis